MLHFNMCPAFANPWDSPTDKLWVVPQAKWEVYKREKVLEWNSNDAIFLES